LATHVDIPDLVAASLSDVGRTRSENQDLFGDFQHGTGGRLLVLADGMGGPKGGATASRILVDGLADFFRSEDGSVEERLRRCFDLANRTIYERANSDTSLEGMGTTGVALLFTAECAHLCWVGDSRAYRLRDGELQQLTEDHSLVSELVRSGVLSAEEAANHPRRNELTRAVGIAEGVDVDAIEIDVLRTDRFLLCSDGLSGVVPHAEIASTLAAHAPELAARALVDRAIALGGPDNVTVQIAAFGAELREAARSEPAPVPFTSQIEAAVRRHDRQTSPLHARSMFFGAGVAVFVAAIAFAYQSGRPSQQRASAPATSPEAPQVRTLPAEVARLPLPPPPESTAATEGTRGLTLEPVVVPPRPTPTASPQAASIAPGADERASADLSERARSLEPLPEFGLAPTVHAFVADWLQAAAAGDFERYRALGFPNPAGEFESTYGRWRDFRVVNASVDAARSGGGRVYLRVVMSYVFHDAFGRWRTEDEHRVVLSETPDGLRFHARWR